MLASNAPTQIPVVFAEGATTPYIRSLPVTSSDPTATTLTYGFPPATFVALAAGGALPNGSDFNGLGNLLAAPIQWAQAGAFYTYNSVFSAAIGGYPNGAVLQKNGQIGLWVSTVDNNASNPDTGGANWVSFILATAYQYEVPFFDAYGSASASAAIVGDTPVTVFNKITNQSVFWSFELTNNINLGAPVKMIIAFTSTVANNNFYMQFQYQNIAVSGLATSYTSTNDTLIAPSVPANLINYATVTAVIPAAALSSNGIINCVLTRLQNNVLDTNTGNLQIINITMVQ